MHVITININLMAFGTEVFLLIYKKILIVLNTLTDVVIIQFKMKFEYYNFSKKNRCRVNKKKTFLIF